MMGVMPTLTLRTLSVDFAYFLHHSVGDSVTHTLNLACPSVSTQPLWSGLQLLSHTAQNSGNQGDLMLVKERPMTNELLG